MATIGSLSIDLDLDSASFQTDMKSAASSLLGQVASMRSSLSGLEDSFGSVITAGKGLLALVGVGSITAFAKQAIDAAAKVQESADSLSLSTKDYQTFYQGLSKDLIIPDEVIEGERLKNSYDELATVIQNGFSTGVVTAFAGDLDASHGALVSIQEAAKDFGFAIGAALNTASIGVTGLISHLKDLEGEFDNATSKEKQFTGGGFWDEAIQQAHNFNTSLQPIADHLNDITSAGNSQRGIGGLLTNTLKSLLDMIPQDAGPAIKAIDGITLATSNFYDELVKADPALAGFIVAYGKLQDNIDKGTSDQFNATALKALKEAGGDQEQFWQATVKATQAGLLEIEAFKQLPSIIKATQSPLENYEDQLAKINELYNDHQLSSEQLFQGEVKYAAAYANQWAQTASSIGGSLASIFKNNKDAAYASALVNVAQGVTATLAQYGWTPLGWAGMAAAAAAGAAQLAAISSTNVGGGGKPATVSTGAGARHTPAAAPTPSASPTAVTFNITGNSVPVDTLRTIFSQLNEGFKKGYTLNIPKSMIKQ